MLPCLAAHQPPILPDLLPGGGLTRLEIGPERASTSLQNVLRSEGMRACPADKRKGGQVAQAALVFAPMALGALAAANLLPHD